MWGFNDNMSFLNKNVADISRKTIVTDVVTIIAIVIALTAIGAYFKFAPKVDIDLGYRPIEVEGSLIEVQNQKDLDVVILNAKLNMPGFITVHRSLSGAPGEVMGISEYMDVGEYEDYKINLSQEMFYGYRYITLLHVDDGDGVFIMDNDLPVMSNGNVVRPDFIAELAEEE